MEHGNQQIEQEHLMLALLTDEQGFIPQLLSAMGMTVPSFAAAVKAEVEKLPKVSGGGREADKVYVAQDVDRALKAAESAAQSMKDEYISVEHILLGLLDSANSRLKELFRTYQVNREAVMQALASVRGNQRVTSDNPEETYDALKSTAPTWWSGPARISWTRSSAGTTRSAMSSASCPARARTTRS